MSYTLEKMNNFEKYYCDQAGNGIAGFSGVKYQKGFGFFGRLLSGAVLPFLRFIGKNALNAGASIAHDISESDDFSLKNIKDVSTKRVRETGKSMLKKAADKVLKGNGIKRKYKRRNLKQKKPLKIKKRSYKRTKKHIKKRIIRKKLLKANDFL